MNVLIVGASRGIGLEFARQYRAAGAQVSATARGDAALEALQALGARALPLDVTNADGIARFAAQLQGAHFGVAVLCAGVYGPHTPGLQAPGQADFDAVMHTNVLGPMRLIAGLGDALAPDAKLAVLSSRMGSIGARTSSNGWLYRASKAALNSVLKDASLALAGRAVCVSFHPGWVRTDMGGAGADLPVEQSVSDIRRVIAALTPADNGRFLNHDGQGIEW